MTTLWNRKKYNGELNYFAVLATQRKNTTGCDFKYSGANDPQIKIQLLSNKIQLVMEKIQ